MKLGATWQAGWDWFAARRQQTSIDAAGEQIKAGDLRGAIKAFDAILPHVNDRQTRALVLRRLMKIRLQLAFRLVKRTKERAAEREFRTALQVLDSEVSGGTLSAGSSISLVGFSLERLAHYKQMDRIALLRTSSSTLAAEASAAAAKQIEGAVADPSSSPAYAVELVSEIADHGLNMVWWLAMHDLLYRRGFVGAAIKAKQAAAASFLFQAGDRSNGAMHLSAAICLDDRGRIETLIATVEDPALKRDGWLALGEIGKARELHAPLRSWSDRRFSAWIGNRSVAVVGPARNALGNGPAIDAHDRVIRTNFIANDAFRSAAGMIGTRTDGAYYNSIFLERQPEDVAATLTSERIGYAMMRTPIERMHFAWQTRGRRTRAYYFTPTIFMARGYAMRHILHDLALQPIDGITCYGSDFFLGENSHFSGYAVWRHAFKHAESYIVHDPLDCWRFMRTLSRAGLVKADSVLDAILTLDEPAFVAALERRFTEEAKSDRSNAGQQGTASGAVV